MRRLAMAKTVADQFEQTLAAAGVKRMGGLVGDSLNGFTDAIRRQAKIAWIHVPHEVAAFAAGADAYLNGELDFDPLGAGDPLEPVRRGSRRLGRMLNGAGNLRQPNIAAAHMPQDLARPVPGKGGANARGLIVNLVQ